MIRLKMKNCYLILTEKPQKYQHYHLKKKNEDLTGKETLSSNQRQIRAYFSLENAIEKQTKTVEDLAKQLKIIKSN